MKPEDNTLARSDPVFFAEHFLGMQLHEGQKRYLLAAKKAIDNGDEPILRRYVLSCANRWGKSATIAILQLWYLYFKFGVDTNTVEEWFNIEYRTANIAPYSSLTEPVFIAIRQIMTSNYPVKDKETGKYSTNKCKIEGWYLDERTINSPPYKQYFGNNSYIEHLSLMGGKGDNLQGKPYGIITYDEAPRSDHLQLELDNSVLGRLLDWTAPLHLLGTPDQDSSSLLYYNDLYKEGLTGEHSSYTQEGSIYENIFMTQKQIEEHELMLEDNPLREQMLFGKFIFGTSTLFPGKDILDAEDPRLDGGVEKFPGHQYVIGIDTAMGTDEIVFTCLDVTEKPFLLVDCYHTKGAARSPQFHLSELIDMVERYYEDNNIQIIIETFNGESARFYQDIPQWIRTFTHTYGSWQPERVKTDNTNPIVKKTALIKKADILIALKKILATKDLKFPKQDYQLIKQLNIYKEDDRHIPTDRVISLALAVWLAGETTRTQKPAWVSIAW
jgi:hypothetical protein